MIGMFKPTFSHREAPFWGRAQSAKSSNSVAYRFFNATYFSKNAKIV